MKKIPIVLTKVSRRVHIPVPEPEPPPVPVLRYVDDLMNREGKPRIVFAENVLIAYGKIEARNGVQYIDGKAATPYMKVMEANRVLKRLGEPQIEGIPECRV